MKNILYIFIVTLLVFSCKKSSVNPEYKLIDTKWGLYHISYIDKYQVLRQVDVKAILREADSEAYRLGFYRDSLYGLNTPNNIAGGHWKRVGEDSLSINHYHKTTFAGEWGVTLTNLYEVLEAHLPGTYRYSISGNYLIFISPEATYQFEAVE